MWGRYPPIDMSGSQLLLWSGSWLRHLFSAYTRRRESSPYDDRVVRPSHCLHSFKTYPTCVDHRLPMIGRTIVCSCDVSGRCPLWQYNCKSGLFYLFWILSRSKSVRLYLLHKMSRFDSQGFSPGVVTSICGRGEDCSPMTSGYFSSAAQLSRHDRFQELWVAIYVMRYAIPHHIDINM